MTLSHGMINIHPSWCNHYVRTTTHQEQQHEAIVLLVLIVSMSLIETRLKSKENLEDAHGNAGLLTHWSFPVP